jgi:CRP-like cAMP-binding protein
VSAALLKPFGLFADLDEAEREDLFELLEERDVSVGETLFEEGDDADALVLLLSGRLQLASRRRSEPVSFGPGTAIGGLALFSVGNREVSAKGAEPCDVRLLRREDFLRFAEDHPRAAFRIAGAVAADVASHARAALAHVALGSVDPADGGE